MPPKRVKRKDKMAHDAIPIAEPPAQIPALAKLPAELFDEIISYLRVLPLSFYYDTYYDKARGNLPHPQFRERTDALRALSATCRALRDISYHRLWSRLDICWVPSEEAGTWYKYVMQSLQTKSKGVVSSSDYLKESIRTITLMLSKSDVAPTMTALRDLLEALPNLSTIQVITCRIPGDFGRATQGLSCPNVRTVVIPTDCHAVLKACPNTMHVRCAGGSGVTLIGSLKFSKCETLDGMINWVKDMKTVDRLIKNAPNLRKIEIRRPVCFGLGIMSQNKAPEQWSLVISKLSGLPKLRVIVLSFPGLEELPSDLVSIQKAREVLRKSKLQEERKLIVRRVIAQHYASPSDNKDHQVGDIVHRYEEEIFS
ncbi:unnamed protein product [Somion occarium]|uniref:F-box domain-containing protein n=1 Tax=Somion occarium TaxID=3059160 RepID=A0ABP1D4D4_9APHY